MKIPFLMQVAVIALLSSPVQAQSDQATADTGSEPVAADGASEQKVPTEIITREVRVTEGDTFFSIARRELGRAGIAPLLAGFNGSSVDAVLTPDEIVLVPILVPREQFGQVVFVKGEVTAIRPPLTQQPADTGIVPVSNNGSLAPPDAPASSTEFEVERDTRVREGDTIRTGPDGYISIEFSSGSVINLQPDTEAVLNLLNCLPESENCVIDLRALKGNVTSDVENRNDQPVDFRISTPYASAAVRGTVFDIDAGSNVLKVGVTEGDVDLTADDALIALPVGFGSVVEQGQAPIEPVQLLPPPVFRRIPARLALGDEVTWWPSDEAISYGALVSNDESGRETLARFSIEENGIGFDTIASGDYFLLLRARDDLGLQGFTSNTRITVADIDEDITPVETTVEKQGREFLVTVIDPPDIAVGYELQISSNDSFDDPLSVDVDTTGSAVFRLDSDQVYTRARVLLDPFTVSAFGESTLSGN